MQQSAIPLYRGEIDVSTFTWIQSVPPQLPVVVENRPQVLIAISTPPNPESMELEDESVPIHTPSKQKKG